MEALYERAPHFSCADLANAEGKGRFLGNVVGI
jgi:hypothetical protein